MKTISANLTSHLQQECTTLASCWKVTRKDGTELFFTDHDADITYDGDTYLSAIGFDRTAIENNSEMSVDNLEVTAIIDSSYITKEDLRAGLYDDADVEIFMINTESPADGPLKVRKGNLGEITVTKLGVFKTELRGLTQRLSQGTIQKYGPICRTDLGSSLCKIPILPDVVERSTAYEVGDFVRVATTTGTGHQVYENRHYECTTAGTTASSEPTYDTTVDNTTTDGTAVFTAREAWTRNAVVASVTDNLTFTITVTDSRAVDDWFNYGGVIWESGNNTGRVSEVRNWTQSGGGVELRLATPYDIEVGDVLAIYAGCNKSLYQCKTRFSNALNRRAEDYIPGDKAVRQLYGS